MGSIHSSSPIKQVVYIALGIFQSWIGNFYITFSTTYNIDRTLHTLWLVKKPMLYQSIKQRKSVFYRFSPHYLYNIWKKWRSLGHLLRCDKTFQKLRTIEECRKHSQHLQLVFSIFPLCPQMPLVFYHSVINGLAFFIC